MSIRAHTPDTTGTPPARRDSPGASPDLHLTPSGPSQQLALLRAENADLTVRLEETEQLLEAAAQSEENWLRRQQESEALIEEKSEVIRLLHQKLQESQGTPPDSEGGKEGDDVAGSGNFETEYQQIEARRRQLEEDEHALMTQMRALELAMSRDRAELARQRSELQRMHAELTRELEQAARDGALRERLAGLTRRSQEFGRPSPPPQTEATPSAPPVDNPPKKNSGLFRRLFGGNTE